MVNFAWRVGIDHARVSADVPDLRIGWLESFVPSGSRKCMTVRAIALHADDFIIVKKLWAWKQQLHELKGHVLGCKEKQNHGCS